MRPPLYPSHLLIVPSFLDCRLLPVLPLSRPPKLRMALFLDSSGNETCFIYNFLLHSALPRNNGRSAEKSVREGGRDVIPLNGAIKTAEHMVRSS